MYKSKGIPTERRKLTGASGCKEEYRSTDCHPDHYRKTENARYYFVILLKLTAIFKHTSFFKDN